MAMVDKVTLLAQKFEELFNILFEGDTWKQDPHYKDTPKRLAKMYVTEVFRNITKNSEKGNLNSEPYDFGLKKYPVTKTTAYNQCDVQVENLTVKAFCAHHLVPFIGTCKVVYKPDNVILGLSKFQRLLDEMCGMPTVQEDLTVKYCETLFNLLQPKEIYVEMTCIHTCMISRGVKLENAKTTTRCKMVKNQMA